MRRCCRLRFIFRGAGIFRRVRSRCPGIAEPEYVVGQAGAEARRGEHGPAGVFGEDLAVARGRGPDRGDSAGECAGRGGEDFAGGGFDAISGASAQRLECGSSAMRRLWSRTSR